MKCLMFLMLLLPAVVFAGSGDKMTGDGQWINGLGQPQAAVFDVHEAINGRPPKGNHYQVTPSGDVQMEVDYADVDVPARRVCYGGFIVDGTGFWASKVGQRLWVTVRDGGDGQEEVGDDKLQAGLRPAWQTTPPPFCTSNTFGNNQPFHSGNAQLHAGKSYQ